jgi:molybdopterin converting factor small subunit
MTRVGVPSQLREYTGGCSEVDAAGATIAELLADLDRRFPGFRLRVVDDQGRLRRHILVFVAGDRRDDLAAVVPAGAEVTLLGALSGG